MLGRGIMEIPDWLIDWDWRDLLPPTNDDARRVESPFTDINVAAFIFRPTLPEPQETETTIEPFTMDLVAEVLDETDRSESTTSGDDFLRGTHGPDEDGNRAPQSDFLFGAGGNDSLRGGQESDLLLGGSNADSFIFLAPDFDDGIITLDIVYDFDISEGDQIVGDQSAFRIFAAGDLGPYGEGIMLEHAPTGDFIFIATSDTGLTLDQLFA